jgi:uncharacterized protein YfaS (alpha-2-macroglobulin family)
MTSNPRHLLVVALSGALLAGAVASYAQDAFRPAAAKQGTVIVPDGLLRRWDPVTLFFASNVGPANGGPEDRPERWVQLKPSHPGAYRWVDAKTLVFRPAEPWPALERFTFRTTNATFRLSTLMAPPVSTIPANGSDDLDPIDALTLTFPEVLPVESLAKMVQIELRPRPGLDGREGRWLSREDVELKPMERRRSADPATYVLHLREPIPQNTRAVVHFQLSLDDTRAESFAEVSFSTIEAFRVVGAGCRGQRYFFRPEGTKYEAEQAMTCRTGERTIEVELSSEPRPVGPVEIKNLVRFDPAVSNVRVTQSGRTLSVAGDFDWDTLYAVSLHPTAVVDRRGRALEMTGTSRWFTFFPRRESYLGLRASQGLVERYGPKFVPLEGRGFDRVDLRIHPVDALDRRFWPFPNRPVVLDETQRPPSPGEEPESIDAGVKAHLEVLSSPPFSKVVELPLRKSGGAATFGLDLAPHLAFLSGERAAGTYLVGVRRLDGSRERSWMRLQVTDLALTSFEETHEVRFLVTRLSSQQPVAGATVRVEGRRSDASGTQWATIFSGATDAQGLVRWVPPGAQPNVSVTITRVVVLANDDKLVLDPSEPPDGYRDNRWSSAKERGWLQWAVQSTLSARGEQPRQLCHIFTERPVYRPDEPVHVKGWFRRRHLGELQVLAPKSGEYQLVIQGPGDLSWRVPATFTAAGGFYMKFAEQDLPTGTYSARLESKALERQGCEVSFQLQSYRLPTFEARIHGPDDVPLDREFELRLTAAYYAGGPVAARPVRWRVTQFPLEWQPPRPLPGFFYSTDSRFSRGPEFRSTPSSGEEHTTSADGAAKLSLNPALEPTAQPRSYVVEATVTGEDETTVTATKRTNALPPFVLGLSVPRFLERAKEITPKIAVFDPKGQLTAGREVVVRLVQRRWHSHLQASDFSDGVAKYVTDVVDEKLLEKKVTSQATPLSVTLPIGEAGVYVVEVEARDRLGRAQVVAVDLYAGGDQPVAWEKPESHIFTVSTDKVAYAPGETAKFVLQSPFQSAKVLAVVEEPGVNRYEWLEVTGGKGVFEYLVKKNQVPRLPVHFVLIRGRAAGAGPRKGAMDLGKPATMAATSWITVTPTENRVEVSMRHPGRARPGEKIDVELALTTPGNKPISGEITLWLVDQAVLALGEEQALDPLGHFITPVNSHLAVRDTRNSIFGDLPLTENPGGDGAEADRSEAEALLDRTTVRKNFASVPYFEPSIVVGPSGKVKVTVQLPDDLTVFKLRAKAASGPDRFGYATGALSVRLPVLVQPALPRFARAGDELLGGGLARMIEGEPGPGHGELRLRGATTKAASKQVIAFDRSKPARLEFPLTVPQPALDERGRAKGANIELTLGVERTSDKARDAFQLTVPILPDRRLEKARLLADLEPGKPLVIPALSEAARPGTLVRTLLVSDEPALVKMAAGLDFLIDYPHGTTEARVSRARALLALKDFRAALATGLDDARSKRAVEETLDWIPSVVDTRGLVAFWPGTDGYVSLTAWTVDFLVEAKRGGFAVDDRLFRTLVATLEAALRSDYARFVQGESWAERVFALEALAQAKRLDPAYAAELARKTTYLNLESVAGVVRAFAASGDRASSTVRGLEPVLLGGLVFRLHQGQEVYGGLQDRNLGARSGLILPSETRTVAEVTRALAELSPDHARLPLLVQALVTLGQGDGWGSTNANASALLALSARVDSRTARRGAGVRTIEVKTGGTSRTLTLGPGAPLAFTSIDGADAIELSASGGGKLVVRAETSWVPAKAGTMAPAISKGFVVTREQRAVGADGAPLEKLELSTPAQTSTRALGAVVEEHVRVVNPVDRTHVAVIVPLASGMEVLNPSLATSPPEAKPSAANTRRATYERFLDDQVAFHFDALPKGTYDFYVRTRATTAGVQTQPGATAELLYDATVFGASPGARLVVTRAER